MPESEDKRTFEPRYYRNPLILAQEWQDRIDAGEAATRAELAQQLGVSRAHVTQVLRVLRLAPGAKQAVLAQGDPTLVRVVGAHTLRSLTKLSVERQECRVAELVGHNGAQGQVL